SPPGEAPQAGPRGAGTLRQDRSRALLANACNSCVKLLPGNGGALHVLGIELEEEQQQNSIDSQAGAAPNNEIRPVMLRQSRPDEPARLLEEGPRERHLLER